MVAKLAIGILTFTLMLFVACASEPPESASPTSLPPTATPTPLPPTATPTPLPPTATPTPLPPTATPTPRPTAALAPGEVIATQIEDLVGVWRGVDAWGNTAYMQYNADGTFALANSVANLESDDVLGGRVRFEGTLVSITDPSCGGGKGEYEVRVRREEDTPTHLTHLLIKDSCEGRIKTLKTPMRWVGP